MITFAEEGGQVTRVTALIVHPLNEPITNNDELSPVMDSLSVYYGLRGDIELAYEDCKPLFPLSTKDERLRFVGNVIGELGKYDTIVFTGKWNGDKMCRMIYKAAEEYGSTILEVKKDNCSPDELMRKVFYVPACFT